MADRIKGITIELDGDTTKLSNALGSVKDYAQIGLQSLRE